MEEQEKKRMFALRAKTNKSRPKFLRSEYHRLKRIQSTWRRPKGIDNKMRHKLKGKRKMPGTGYRSPKKVRHLHPSGFEVVPIFNTADLDKIEKGVQIAQIGRTVGSKKRIAIIEHAEDLGIHVINPRIRTENILKEEELDDEEYGLAGTDESDETLDDDLDDENLDKLDLDDENLDKLDLDDENLDKLDLDDENLDKLDLDDENLDKLDLDDENLDKLDLDDENLDKLDLDDENLDENENSKQNTKDRNKVN